LWPYTHFASFFEALQTIRADGYRIDASIQTNAYKKFDKKFLQLLDSNDVVIGISLDGPAQYNDKFRITKSRNGSYSQVISNVDAIIQAGYKHLIGGFLVVAQPELPVEDFLSWIDTLPIKRVDVLWPIQFNHDNPPWSQTNEASYKNTPVYGTWFSKLFTTWWQRDDPEIYIRLFYGVLQRSLGASHHLDALVNDKLDMFVINTDGRVEYPDYLRAVSDEASKSIFNIARDEICAFSKDPVFNQLLNLGKSLPKECEGCQHKDICGGGFLPGRTSKLERITKSKSVLCADQFLFFSEVKSTIHWHTEGVVFDTQNEGHRLSKR
jgi:uncharacterized protein